MKLWVDPAEGWKHGFPRIWDDEKHPDCTEWMVECGYPREMTELPVRVWPVAEEKEDE